MGLGNGLGIGEGQRAGGIAALVGDRDIENGLRGGDLRNFREEQVWEQVGELGITAASGATILAMAPRTSGTARMAACCWRTKPVRRSLRLVAISRSAGAGAALGLGGRGLDHTRFRRQIIEGSGDDHSCAAIHGGMVHLGIERHTPVIQPFDNGELPERDASGPSAANEGGPQVIRAGRSRPDQAGSRGADDSRGRCQDHPPSPDGRC